jgi:carboxypeptidase-like protein/TonB-dependent receptor-like protein
MTSSKSWIFLVLLFIAQLTYAQQSYTISGYIKDAATGETLIGANVFNKNNTPQGTTTNAYGFYSLTVPEGDYNFQFTYLGYTSKEIKIALKENTRINIELIEGIEIETVIVTGEAKDRNVSGTEMGTIELPVENIKTLPAIFGEVDVLKTLQLLPGVLSSGEGNSGFYVRGGGPDQNLVLLDEAVVYNSGHMLGFFSVFNADAIKNTTLIKGGMPAYYGGRLSSVVDVQMKEGNNKNYAVAGGIGLIASRLTVEGPIQKDISSFMVSARRTYAFDVAQPALKGTDFDGTNYYFYDLNTKVNYRFSDKDRLYLSGYFGRDVLNYESALRGFSFRLPYGNTTGTLRWNHLFSDKLFMNVSAIYNDYDFAFNGSQSDFSVKVISGVRDYNAKVDFDFFPTIKHAVKFGVNYTFHKMTPNLANATSGEVDFENDLQIKYAHEAAIYIQDDYKISQKLSVNVGLRGTMFTQVGPFTSSISGESFKKLEPVKTYTGIEPRLTAKYSLDKSTSIKAGFTMNNQYIHLVSSSSSTLPTDIWVPSSELVKPQNGIQYALGYFKNFRNDQYESSIEVYYKDLNNQIDYRETYVNDVAVDVENDFVFGTGRSFGMELFLKKSKGALNGWIGYTLAKTDRRFDDINDGKRFNATYDRTHDLSVVCNYKISPKWALGGVFVYGTGNSFTPIKSLYFIENNLNVEYGQRNSARISAYHRVDFSATLTPKPFNDKNFTSSWTFSVYNLYNRKNPFFIYYATETDTENLTAKASAYKVSLFPIIPSVTWNFSWTGKKEEAVTHGF